MLFLILIIHLEEIYEVWNSLVFQGSPYNNLGRTMVFCLFGNILSWKILVLNDQLIKLYIYLHHFLNFLIYNNNFYWQINFYLIDFILKFYFILFYFGQNFPIVLDIFLQLFFNIDYFLLVFRPKHFLHKIFFQIYHIVEYFKLHLNFDIDHF